MDNQSTTQVDPLVLEAMLPYFAEELGNAASKSHAYGWRAEAAVDRARAQVASLVGCSPTEVIFTSGATESNNLALKGAFDGRRRGREKIATVSTEHKSVLDPCKRLGEDGAKVHLLPVGPEGLLSVEEVERTLDDSTLLLSVMLANNEIGVLQPIARIGRVCRERGVLFHCDGAQGIGKVPFSFEASSVDLLSLSGHKIHGPKGVGALCVGSKARGRIRPLLEGGGHERGLRSGTLNVPGIVGLGKAAEIASSRMAEEAASLLKLRERLREGLLARLEGVWVNGSLSERLPGNLNVSFDGVESDLLMAELREVAVSSGSACSSASPEPSYVLRALGLSEERARSSIRFGLGRFNTEKEVDQVVEAVVEKVQRLRGQASGQVPQA